MIHHGDLFDVLPTLAEGSIDACVTDPPYELKFMGKHWDGSGVAFQVETWREVLRVLKPGAHLAAFGGTRTFHRMTVAIEDAGFEIRDCLSWLYGSGFPKSLNLGDGRGTALKPSWEPIVLARKPLRGTVAKNVEQYGTGALNIDACRIETSPDDAAEMERCNTANSGRRKARATFTLQAGSGADALDCSQGRWPANVLLDEEAAELLDEQTGEMRARGNAAPTKRNQSNGVWATHGSAFGIGPEGRIDPGDSGGASRFYYVAKPSRAERDMGCEGLNKKPAGSLKSGDGGWAHEEERGRKPRHAEQLTARNIHPTVKPVELMRWLVKLVTPPGGTVLDPFTGSGTTGMACRYELRPFIGIEREAEYIEIAERRIAAVAPLFGEATA